MDWNFCAVSFSTLSADSAEKLPKGLVVSTAILSAQGAAKRIVAAISTKDAPKTANSVIFGGVFINRYDTAKYVGIIAVTSFVLIGALHFLVRQARDSRAAAASFVQTSSLQPLAQSPHGELHCRTACNSSRWRTVSLCYAIRETTSNDTLSKFLLFRPQGPPPRSIATLTVLANALNNMDGVCPVGNPAALATAAARLIAGDAFETIKKERKRQFNMQHLLLLHYRYAELCRFHHGMDMQLTSLVLRCCCYSVFHRLQPDQPIIKFFAFKDPKNKAKLAAIAVDNTSTKASLVVLPTAAADLLKVQAALPDPESNWHNEARLSSNWILIQRFFYAADDDAMDAVGAAANDEDDDYEPTGNKRQKRFAWRAILKFVIRGGKRYALVDWEPDGGMTLHY
jgi:hypothetical protein